MVGGIFFIITVYLKEWAGPVGDVNPYVINAAFVTAYWSFANCIWVFEAVEGLPKDHPCGYTVVAPLSFAICILLGLWAWHDDTGFAITHYPAAPPFPPSPPLPPSPPTPPPPEWWSPPTWVQLICFQAVAWTAMCVLPPWLALVAIVALMALWTIFHVTCPASSACYVT